MSLQESKAKTKLRARPRSPDIITQITLVSDYLLSGHKFHCHPHVVNLNSCGDLFRHDYYMLDLLVVRALLLVR